MLRRIQTNKKITLVVALFLALCVGIIVAVMSECNESKNTNFDIKAEQDKEHKKDADVYNDTEVNRGLEVLKPDEVAAEDSSNASGTWGNEAESNTQTGTEETDRTENKKPNDEDTEVKDEDILEDDIIWGDIY